MSSVDKLMRDTIDFHVHASPDPFRKRRLDALDLARQAKEAGMRAIVIKCHQYCTSPLAYIVNRVVPGFTLLGSLALNREVGGLNPQAVEVAARIGARVVWMPTLSSTVDTARKAKEIGRATDGGISILTLDGKLVPEIDLILETIKNYNMVLATGHISVPEIYAIVDEAQQRGIPVTITHPLTSFVGTPLTLEQQKELVSKGTYIEHCFVACTDVQGLNPAAMVKHIKAVGAEHCVLSTDFGQEYNPAPPEGFRMMLATMLKAGLSEKELEITTRVNPARLLGLDTSTHYQS